MYLPKLLKRMLTYLQTLFIFKNFSKETLPNRKDLWEKEKALRKEDKVVYLNYKSVVVRKRNDPEV